MSTPTPRTDEQINGKPCTRFCVFAGDSLRDALVPSDFARTLERELATERAKARVLRSACESICEEWGKNHDAPFYAGSEMEKLASKALEKLEDAQ